MCSHSWQPASLFNGPDQRHCGQFPGSHERPPARIGPLGNYSTVAAEGVTRTGELLSQVSERWKYVGLRNKHGLYCRSVYGPMDLLPLHDHCKLALPLLPSVEQFPAHEPSPTLLICLQQLIERLCSNWCNRLLAAPSTVRTP